MDKVIQMQAKAAPIKRSISTLAAYKIFMATYELILVIQAASHGGYVHIAELFAPTDGEFLVNAPQASIRPYLEWLSFACELEVVTQTKFILTIPQATILFIENYGAEISAQPAPERMTELMAAFLLNVNVTV